MFGGILVLLFGLAIFIGLVVIYVFTALALKTMADHRNIENSWLAFVPIANFYIIGLLIGKITLAGYTIEQTELVLPAVLAAGIFLNSLPVIGSLISLLGTAASLIAFYHLFKKYAPENAVLYTVLTFLVIPTPFILYAIKDREPQY